MTRDSGTVPPTRPRDVRQPVDLTRTAAYDYELPPDRIARYPAERRDRSRLLVVPRGDGEDLHDREFFDLRFSDLPRLLRTGDLLVLNESRVLPARLLGRKPTGAAGEVLLLRPVAGERASTARRWEALVRPGSKLKPGRELVISEDLRVVIEDGLEGGGRIVRLESDLPVEEALSRYGRVPLPPYLERTDEPLDRDRYQTVFARDPGSVAAPTAGLHFTEELLESLTRRGVEVAKITLHVGPGTFRPVEAEAIRDHHMHRELWEVPQEAADAVAATRSRGGRIWAVGTTVVRTLESAAQGEREGDDAQGAGATGAGLGEARGAPDAVVRPGSGSTDLFIAPGYRFRVVDGLITNFHLPRSTLLMLVAAFAGYETTMAMYEHAVERDYRFYSYGDAMAILPSGSTVEAASRSDAPAPAEPSSGKAAG